ncbi:DUF4411 family protein [Thalassolituus sp. ST750PaO-4]|uniref:DUF4411 family protein n=1 Tax=Thalassolituus sp. ST750PaO-4 TaxID=2742965 RepID=UPI000C69F53F|nr:DUF4411 family protein [Thalassolituus sp. ST750PaO-4]MCA6059072.1 DUF4411 family protein [Thalassolituus sp. ST750PaO-4]PIQ39265.1 MAG: hypothetical protein COW58_12595 [Thalassolituus sp. CG17_big_fil_post_rev_8_21_14_2_50_53_8]
MNYLLDSNTYIQAKNQYYGMAFCPAYWDWLDAKFASGEVGSIAFIGKELRDGKDELADWAKKRSPHFISHSDDETQGVYVEIVNHVMEQDYNPANRDQFLAKGDPWLIAKAKVLGATLVTHEATVAPATKKVKIPNICKEFGVRCITTFDMLHELQPKFTLEASER